MKLFKSFITGIVVSTALLLLSSCGIIETKDCPGRITVSSLSECQSYCGKGDCGGYVDDATGTFCTCY